MTDNKFEDVAAVCTVLESDRQCCELVGSIHSNFYMPESVNLLALGIWLDGKKLVVAANRTHNMFALAFDCGNEEFLWS